MIGAEWKLEQAIELLRKARTYVGAAPYMPENGELTPIYAVLDRVIALLALPPHEGEKCVVAATARCTNCGCYADDITWEYSDGTTAKAPRD